MIKLVALTLGSVILQSHAQSPLSTPEVVSIRAHLFDTDQGMLSDIDVIERDMSNAVQMDALLIVES